MAQSPISDARTRRDGITLNPNQQEATDAELSAAEGQATEAANETLARIESEFNEATDGLLVEGAELRSGYQALAQEAQSGRLSADEVAARLESLARRRSVLDRQLSELAQAIDLADQIEADPLAYIDDLWRRFPQTAPHFSF